VAAVHEWDQLRRQVDTWSALAQLRFEQDTRVPSHREAREYAEDGRFHFDVRLFAPLTGGLMVHYRGHLIPANPDDPSPPQV
jgi:hypothetical protein